LLYSKKFWLVICLYEIMFLWGNTGSPDSSIRQCTSACSESIHRSNAGFMYD